MLSVGFARTSETPPNSRHRDCRRRSSGDPRRRRHPRGERPCGRCRSGACHGRQAPGWHRPSLRGVVDTETAGARTSARRQDASARHRLGVGVGKAIVDPELRHAQATVILGERHAAVGLRGFGRHGRTTIAARRVADEEARHRRASHVAPVEKGDQADGGTRQVADDVDDVRPDGEVVGNMSFRIASAMNSRPIGFRAKAKQTADSRPLLWRASATGTGQKETLGEHAALRGIRRNQPPSPA